MDILQVLTIFGFGSFFGIVVKHFLDKGKEKEARIFAIKHEAYSRAIGVLSGFGNRTVHFILSNSKRGEVGHVSFIDYLTKVSEEIAPAILLSGQGLEEKLSQINNRALGVFEIIRVLLNNTEKTAEGHYVAGKPIEVAKELLQWKTKQEEFEKELVYEMRKELKL